MRLLYYLGLNNDLGSLNDPDAVKVWIGHMLSEGTKDTLFLGRATMLKDKTGIQSIAEELIRAYQ